MNEAVITRVLRELDGLGVREFCVAAGARNAPLISALLASTGVTVRHFFEERSAAFFALGRIMADRAPVAVVTTSGTAAGELLPAVMEAHYQGLPLVLVTADRPAHYRGSGAPQAVEQCGIFGGYAEPTLDVSDGNHAEVMWPQTCAGRPLHINICLDEPLDSISAGHAFGVEGIDRETNFSNTDLTEHIEEGTLILAAGLHPADAKALVPLLRDLSLPILAEATSNLLDQGALQHLLVRGGEQALRALDPRSVIRLGAVPSWRWWRDLEKRPDVRVINVTRSAFPGLARKENVVTLPWPPRFSPDADHTARSDHTAAAIANLEPIVNKLHAAIENHPLSEMAWMRWLDTHLPAASRVMLGNSLAIREFNLTAWYVEQQVEFFANRGANGIDGIVSTYLGLSVTSDGSWLIIGDLSALYDLAAPWILPQLPPARRRIVVINNGGGKIFSRVDSLRSLPAETRTVIENSHTLDFQPWAKMWGMDYRLWTQPDESQFNDLPDRATLIEIRPAAAESEAFWTEWHGGWASGPSAAGGLPSPPSSENAARRVVAGGIDPGSGVL
jgi:2-succinyl-5-enolpyruvyl-6-hydroxy-3-cyclohexene-1-carboxylate synthase